MPWANYFARLSRGKSVLWCYLIWYAVTVWLRFDAAPAIWWNAVGLSLVIGVGLLLSIGGPREPWQTARLFMMPFCVSSFSSLVKGHGYWLIFPPDAHELALGLGACAVFLAGVAALQARARGRAAG